VSQEQVQLLSRLREAILNYEEEKAVQATQEIIEQKIDPLSVMNTTIAQAASLVGEKFDRAEIFLPHLVMAGDIMSKVSDMLEASLSPEQSRELGGKVVVIGTVESDIHSIGKSIVAMLLKANGYKVFDLGVDVKSEQFVQKAQEHKGDVIAMSSLLTTTMPYQKEVIEDLERLKQRDKFKVLVGGGPVTRKWAEDIKADAFGKDAVQAVEVVRRLTEEKGK
jgi:trimethylamine corrinoid protein